MSIFAAEIIPLDLGSFFRPADETATGVAREDALMAYLVRHADGLLLFDSGFGEVDAETEAHYLPRRVPLTNALDRVGAALEQIDLIVNCHLHPDHIGGNRLLPGIPIVAQARELHGTRGASYAPTLIDFPGARYREIDGPAELAPGVRILPTPGHTAGHQSLVVETAAGTVVLAGQAREQEAEFAADPVGSIVRERPVEVLFAHDRAVWRP